MDRRFTCIILIFMVILTSCSRTDTQLKGQLDLIESIIEKLPIIGKNNKKKNGNSIFSLKTPKKRQHTTYQHLVFLLVSKLLT